MYPGQGSPNARRDVGSGSTRLWCVPISNAWATRRTCSLPPSHDLGVHRIPPGGGLPGIGAYVTDRIAFRGHEIGEKCPPDPPSKILGRDSHKSIRKSAHRTQSFCSALRRHHGQTSSVW
jgi:hypothetical protein